MKNVALVLLVGLVAGALLAPSVRAEGPRPAGAVRWQQFCDPAASINDASTMARARGLEGYELIGFFGGALCFKRPMADAPRPAASLPAAETHLPGNPYGI